VGSSGCYSAPEEQSPAPDHPKSQAPIAAVSRTPTATLPKIPCNSPRPPITAGGPVSYHWVH